VPSFDLVLVLVDTRLDDVEDQPDLVFHVFVRLGDIQVLRRVSMK